MDPGNSRGPVATRAADTTNLPLRVQRAADIACGRAYAGPPVRGRELWAVTVLSCPLCGGMHQHRVGQAAQLLSGRVDRECPVTGRPYRLAPVQRRREARRVA